MNDVASVAAGGLDALPSQVAVLDGDGGIIYTNDEWRSFARANDYRGDPGALDRNYLEVCETSDGEDAAAAADGIRSVLAGDRDTFSFEYPCHSPDQRRWFLMRAVSYEWRGDDVVLVMHLDITDRKLAELRSDEQRAKLETVARVLSHDIRNPLNVALGHLELLDGEHAGAAAASLERIDDMITNALVLARQSTVDDPDLVSLADSAERAWKHVDTRDATLHVTADATFRADADLLGNVFENLFRNAVEHAGSDATVTVGPTDDGFFVEDDGPGVPESERDAVFEVGHSTQGSGLGLAIVAEIADAHGWHVRVTDGGSGGARFEFAGVERAE